MPSFGSVISTTTTSRISTTRPIPIVRRDIGGLALDAISSTLEAGDRRIVASELTWKNVAEQAAYGRLSDMLPATEKLGLTETHEKLAALLLQRRQDAKWGWGLFEDVVNGFRGEFSNQNPVYEHGFVIVDGVLNKAFEVKRRKGKRMDILEVRRDPRERVLLEQSLHKVNSRILKATDSEVAVMLAGLAHIIRYETKGEFARRRIYSWTQPWLENKGERRQLAEDFLHVATKGSDGKADTTHIRHAFAHAHFELESPSQVWLWDEENGEDTFATRMEVLEFLEFCNIFEKKLSIADIYPSLLVAIEDLFSVYKREWRALRP